MRNLSNFTIAILLVLLLAACTAQGDKKHQAQQGDSLYTERAAMEIYDTDPDRALVLIDSAALVGNISEDLANMLKARVYGHSTEVRHLDTTLTILEALMETNYVKDSNSREMVLDLLVSVTRKKCDFEQCLRWASEKADLCRRMGEETEALRTEAEIGVLLVELGEEEKGIEKLNSVISSLEGQRQVDEMDACVIAVMRKIQVLQRLDRQAEVIPMARRMLAIVDDFRQHTDEYEDNSYRMTTDPEQVEKYCNFYTAQAQGYAAMAYASLADNMNVKGLLRSDNAMATLRINHAMDSARYYLSLFERSDYGRTIGGRRAMAPTWCLMGEYDKMLSIYNELSARMGDDTVNVEYLEILRGRAIAAEARGNLAAAINYGKRHKALNDELNRQTHRSQIHEYAVRYHLYEERLKTEREHAVRRQVSIVAMSLGLIVLLVIAVIIIMGHQMLAIRKKNSVLSKEIAERIDYEEKYRALVDKLKADRADAESDKEGQSASSSAYKPLDAAALATLGDGDLFEYLRHIIMDEKLYLDPHFDRQQLVDRVHISKDRIGAAFAKGSPYRSMKNFLNEVRLQHSTKLLAEHQEMSINEVTTASGFANYAVFARNFKLRFAMTPSEFREHESFDLPVKEDE